MVALDPEAEDESPPSSPPAVITPRFRPCIAELLRTLYCPPQLILLVTKIREEYPVYPCRKATAATGGGGEGKEGTGKGRKKLAYRLWLSDGVWCIQALLKAEMHRFVLTGETGEGSYVRLDKYELQRAKRLNGNGSVVYIAIHDFCTVGWKTPDDGNVLQDAAVEMEEAGTGKERNDGPPALRADRRQGKDSQDECPLQNPLAEIGQKRERSPLQRKKPAGFTKGLDQAIQRIQDDDGRLDPWDEIIDDIDREMDALPP